MAKLESLVIDLQLETAELKKGLDDVKKRLGDAARASEGLFASLKEGKEQLEGFGRQAKEAFEAFKAVAGFEVLKEVGEFAFEAAKKIGEFVLEGAEAADKMGKLAAAAQVPVETFQRLAYAAKLGGSSAEDMSGAFSKLNRALGEAEQGSVKQASLFKALGVSLTDSSGKARGSADIFQELATKLTEMGAGYAKSDIEQQLFGKSGAALDSTLKNVAEGMAKAGGEADQFGLVLDEHAIKAATEFHDNIERIKTAVEGAASRIAANLSPALNTLTSEFLRSKSSAEGLTKIVDGLSDAIKATITLAVAFKATLEATAGVVGGLVSSTLLLLTGHMKAAGDTMRRSLNGAVIDVAKGMLDAQKIWVDSGKVVDDLRKGMQGLEKATESADDALRKQKGAEEYAAALKKVQEFIAGYQEKLDELNDDGPFAKLEAQLADGPIADAFKKLGKDADAFKDKVRQIFSDLQSGKLGKLQAELDIKIEKGNVAADALNQGRRQNLYDVQQNTTPEEAALRVTKGFADFEAALAEIAKQTDVQGRALAAAEAFKIEKDQAAVDKYTAMGEAAGEAKDRAIAAANGFKTLAEIIAKQNNTVQGAMSAFAGAVLKAVPRLNELIQAAQQGASVGGVWGALIAVFIELASKTKSFQDILGIVDHDLDKLISGLEPLVSGFEKLMEALAPITDMITGIITSSLSPIGDILKILAPILKLIAGVIALVLSPIKALADMVATNFSKAGKVAAGMAKAFDDAFKEIDKAIHAVENWIASITKSIPTQFVAEGTGTVVVKSADAPAAAAVDDLGNSAGKAATQLNKLTEAFANVPEGFRRTLRTYQATDQVAGVGYGEIASPGLKGLSTTINVYGNLIHENALLEMVDERQKRKNFQRTGKPP